MCDSPHAASEGSQASQAPPLEKARCVPRKWVDEFTEPYQLLYESSQSLVGQGAGASSATGGDVTGVGGSLRLATIAQTRHLSTTIVGGGGARRGEGLARDATAAAAPFFDLKLDEFVLQEDAGHSDRAKARKANERARAKAGAGGEADWMSSELVPERSDRFIPAMERPRQQAMRAVFGLGG
eukprot:GHVU01167590.1.p1 GENE.GHVU01167590.1~~GHVU01167590.1.p1  ORF type:complete len:183 (+),score=29.73 GHVU01167590.1:1-549(+)